MQKPTILLAGALTLFVVTAVKAGLSNAVFDFEAESTTVGGGLNSLNETNNGLTISIDRVGQPFDIADLSHLAGTSAFGARSLAPTPPGSNFFNVNFSQGVSSFSTQLGDFGTGRTDALAITAFTGVNGTGKNLGSVTKTLPLTSDTVMSFKTLAIAGTGIRSVEFLGGTTTAANSVFADNFKVGFPTTGGTGGSGGTTGGGGSTGGGGAGNSVPLPSAAYVMPFGFAAAWYASRKLRRSHN